VSQQVDAIVPVDKVPVWSSAAHGRNGKLSCIMSSAASLVECAKVGSDPLAIVGNLLDNAMGDTITDLMPLGPKNIIFFGDGRQSPQNTQRRQLFWIITFAIH
jgi:hypothetical protein